jgi:hypothetical protein
MTDRELMQQALDALRVMRPACFAETTLKAADNAITALRDRLAQPEQGPVAWYDKHGMVTHDPFEGVTPLYAAPRPWVGLTDEEIDHAAEQSDNYASFIAGALFAQNKLKEKNI